MTEVQVAFSVAHAAEQADRAVRAIAAEVTARMPLSLARAVEYALQGRGKRLRPVLCCAGYAAVRRGQDIPDAMWRLACALELIHSYSLVHDDLPCMDNDDLRRGRPTAHRVFGAPMAVLAGAALIPAAMGVLDAEAAALGLDVSARGRLVRELARAAGAAGMVGGQWRDLEAESEPVDAMGLERIHREKTGALLAVSLWIGGTAAGATPEERDALSSYGQVLGLAFQITDDLLDGEGKPEVTGKSGGRDQALGKSTYPGLYGAARARALAEERVRDAITALAAAGLDTPALVKIARHVVERQG
ncbi:polyprenyl synthetase family protein [soil metagenome]